MRTLGPFATLLITIPIAVDVLLGSRVADLLSGGPGRDTAYGRGGRDRFFSIERQR